MPIIEVNHVTKEFKLGQLQNVKLGMQRMLARLNGRPIPQRVNFKALSDVHFQVDEGEVLGIIGSNGAGKSTLLKILSNITAPTAGNVRVNGSVAPLIEVGAGLVGDLTGRENIYLNGAILGLSKKSISRKFDEIVEFAELEDFLDTPIKRYSSGMSVRLGFSIATIADADILIVDEVLAVGDLAFQRKCFDRMEDMIKRQKKTVLLVSHNIRQVERLCTRVLLLDEGSVLMDGSTAETCNLFYERSDEKIRHNAKSVLKRMGRAAATGDVELLEVQVLDKDASATSQIIYKSEITVVLTIRANTLLPQPMFGIGVHTTDFIYLATEHSEHTMLAHEMVPGIHEVRCNIPEFPFLPGVYALSIGIAVGTFVTPVFYNENAFFFQVIPQEQKRTQAMQEGFVSCGSQWSAKRVTETVADDRGQNMGEQAACSTSA
jgi:lipopolysaccharide transport system ATP-binding protein